MLCALLLTLTGFCYCRISFSGVKLVGGGAIEFLSELYLQNAFEVHQGEVYFLREYNTSALTGPGVIFFSVCSSFG